VTESGCVFTINNGEPKLVLEGAPQGNLLLFAHPNRDLVVVAGTNEIRLMDIQNREVVYFAHTINSYSCLKAKYHTFYKEANFS
jgi:hypothetical protein